MDRSIDRGLQADEAFAPRIHALLEAVGVDGFADSAVIVGMRIETFPIEQWNFAREPCRRIGNRLDEEGI